MLTEYFHNPKKDLGPYTAELQSVLNLDHARLAYDEIKSWAGYKVTPLHSLKSIASDIGIAEIYFKDESRRLGLDSFKALGGTFGVLKFLHDVLRQEIGHHVTIEDIRNAKYSENCSKYTVATATDGNHGRAVAMGAKLFGCQCQIYIHSEVSLGRESAMESLGASVIRVPGNYDESFRFCIKEAEEKGWQIISDTSYEGYTKYPTYVMAGYTVMAEEIMTQVKNKPRPTHVFLQGGVGAFPAAICSYFWEKLAEPYIKFIVVESELAACLIKSAQNGKRTSVHIEQETMMAGLSCGEPSLLGWKILNRGADDFITIDDGTIPEMMRLLSGYNPKIEAGESSVAGLAALFDVMKKSEIAREIGLDKESVVLLFGTEGATDPEIYRTIVR